MNLVSIDDWIDIACKVRFEEQCPRSYHGLSIMYDVKSKFLTYLRKFD